MLSEALRLMRVFHDLKQQDLADKLDISKSHLSEIESGKKVPSLDLIGRYSDVFGVPASSILFFGENVKDGEVRSADQKVKSAIAGKVVQFLKFIETRTDGKHQGIRA
ncbi:MAG: helix-turn-helix domain-containing protein [Alphaproteobacteria bacterium]|jgi:transcriptional regulator with XRE-family HTH domain|nr:helix-turn-helix domain-containing protein [Alphaproteobacteria bacterium]MBU2125268.1 helix-turn-helix domain-containing protein [Alphaproteobacteria bacterium]MBU2208254.1 helix-turn-helix domain-containing protein [Alphaproteobacteria bacterium]